MRLRQKWVNKKSRVKSKELFFANNTNDITNNTGGTKIKEIHCKLKRRRVNEYTTAERVPAVSAVTLLTPLVQRAAYMTKLSLLALSTAKYKFKNVDEFDFQ